MVVDFAWYHGPARRALRENVTPHVLFRLSEILPTLTSTSRRPVVGSSRPGEACRAPDTGPGSPVRTDEWHKIEPTPTSKGRTLWGLGGGWGRRIAPVVRNAPGRRENARRRISSTPRTDTHDDQDTTKQEYTGTRLRVSSAKTAQPRGKREDRDG